MPIRTFLGEFARACLYRIDAADEPQRGRIRRQLQYQSSLCDLSAAAPAGTVLGYVI